MFMKRILLADDHSFVRLGLIQILKDEYPVAEIKEVNDGSSLVKEVSLANWDLIISDLDMPGQSGLQALEQIKLEDLGFADSGEGLGFAPELTEELGATRLFHGLSGDEELVVAIAAAERVEPGHLVAAAPGNVHLFDAVSGRSLRG